MENFWSFEREFRETLIRNYKIVLEEIKKIWDLRNACLIAQEVNEITKRVICSLHQEKSTLAQAKSVSESTFKHFIPNQSCLGIINRSNRSIFNSYSNSQGIKEEHLKCLAVSKYIVGYSTATNIITLPAK